ncbi:hypothetical protein DVH07_13510 [Hafnia paralvei]|nr:hypothetical protein DU449_13155 [Hafnia paralvei]RDA66455.1 hypothetical protein DVH09_13525 [Hafnia paralvei]RDA67898.1 hypothetical protein DVH08_12065 [Hafnia paralvei]RDA76912.1 hypothetical protein DVH10_13290 [Hafnia paralvei]RDA77412.1 hypothetical protein DVH07_13510 [Hafnia paralvei]
MPAQILQEIKLYCFLLWCLCYITNDSYSVRTHITW